MASTRKEKIVALLKGLETGDPDSVTVVDEIRYVQHNPQTAEGSLGLAELFREIAKSNPRVNVVRIFEDGDFVFGHTEYDFARRNIGFEIFRFEGDKTVEHWDNIQPRKGPNPSGHSMVDGPVEATDHALTESNRELVRQFVNEVLIGRQAGLLTNYIDSNQFVEHNPVMADDLEDLKAMLVEAEPITVYQHNHRLLAEGNFVLSVSQGQLNGKDAALFDLFRIEDAKIVEHWDTTEIIPARSEWKNDNGKF